MVGVTCNNATRSFVESAEVTGIQGLTNSTLMRKWK